MANEKVQSTIKSTDTEETIDIYWTRPIGYMWACLFEKLGVHPNTVTIISMFLGAAAGICFGFDTAYNDGEGLWINVIGVALLAWANFYDSCDGQLARMTGKKTKLGRILDGAAGDIWYIFIYFALVWRMWYMNIPFTEIQWGVIGFVFVAIDGLVCHVRQCRLADYYRNIHLFFVKGKSGSELDDYVQQSRIFDELSWKDNFIEKFFQMFYKNHCREQYKATPQFQQLMVRLREKYGEDIPASIPQDFRDKFRKGSFPVLKWTNFLTFNWRANFLYLSCLLNLPWLVIAVEVFVFTAVLIHMQRYHENMCKQLINEI